MIRHMNRRLVVVIAFLGFLAFGLILLLQRPTAGGHKPIKRAEDPNRRGTLTADFQTKDFPEHGVRLIGPSSPEFAQLAQLIKSNEDSGTDVVPVFLKNTSKHSVVGYRITWECVDKAGIADVRDKSDIISYVFLHGDESDRVQAMACDAGVMEPNSTWFISLDRPTQRVQDVGAGQTERWIPGPELQRISKQCSKVMISLDGFFFDDGTFLGPDTREFFNEVESQMDARHEILSKVESDLKSGVRVDDIFRKLEQIAGQPRPELPELPSRAEYMSFFRIVFAKDILGMKNVFGTEKAIEDVHQQLSKPWVKLRKL